MKDDRREVSYSVNTITTGVEQYAEEYCEANDVLKLFEDEKRVEIGITENTTQSTLDSLVRFHSGKNVVFKKIEKIDITSRLGHKDSVLSSVGSPKNVDVLQKQDEKLLLDKLANDAPIVNLVNSICIDGIRLDASDIHIEACESHVRVRYRINGILKTVNTIDSSKFAAIASRIKIMANLNIMERRLPQDGRMTVNIGDDAVDLRVSIIPTAYGESIVLRLFNKKKRALELDQLGFSSQQLNLIRSFYTIPHGLVLVTGPTGSGKTTTLNAMIKEMVSDGLNIITIEDPVEYLIDGVNQIQTNEAIGLSFETILRRVLRQDPNVIMVGEIRDPPTAELAVRAALTGHLVLSTLHTNDSVSVISRLRNMGIEPYLIGAVLRGAIAQRLVRNVCPSCSEEYQPDEHESKLIARYSHAGVHSAKGKGCQKCDGSGYSGRMVISEAFAMSPALEKMITKETNQNDIMKYLADQGWVSLAGDGIEKVTRGLTTFDELIHEVVL